MRGEEKQKPEHKNLHQKPGHTLFFHAAPLLHRVLGIYLPLITSNCEVLGVALLNLREQNSMEIQAPFGKTAVPALRLTSSAGKQPPSGR